METLNVIQGTQEWKDARWLTASNADVIATNGKGLQTLVLETLADKLAFNEQASFTSQAMDRGIELEAQARAIYELEKNTKIETVGFVQRDEYVGCSPDGLVGENGLVEFKCLMGKNYLSALLLGDYDKGYWWQCQMQLMITGRQWVDLCFYTDNFEVNMHIVRIYPDAEAFKKLEAGLERGVELIKSLKETYDVFLSKQRV